MTVTTVRRSTVIVCAAIALAACGGSPAKPAARTPKVTYSPLSGMPVTSPDQRVLVVKVENTAPARPQLGLSEADIVFVEEVEGGITRFAAVYSSQRPETVGPVRSARITDPQLVAQFGSVAFAYSGAQAKMAPVLRAASLIEVRESRSGTGWTRSTERGAPHNLYGHPTGLLEQAGEGVSEAVDIGREFSQEPPSGGTAVASVVAKYPAERMTIDWLGTGWQVSSGKDIITDGAPVRPGSILIQYVKQAPSQFHDRHGGVTPFAETIGSGTGVYLRDGRYWRVTWQRPTESDPTTWLDATGQPVQFARGTIWNLLVPKDRRVEITRPAAGASPSTSP
ncbi:MAG: DUF3048 domain-containing protein [Actinobacteria bacterium]|nr:DUF3048 domain-containing protein [Actinomycetota bacterium]